MGGEAKKTLRYVTDLLSKAAHLMPTEHGGTWRDPIVDDPSEDAEADRRSSLLSPSSVATDFQAVANMPYMTWISRLQLIPATIVHTEIDEASVEQLVAGIASLVTGFPAWLSSHLFLYIASNSICHLD